MFPNLVKIDHLSVAFWKDVLEELALANVDFTHHPTSTSTLPYICLYLLCPPTPFSADAPHVTHTKLLSFQA